MGRKRVARFASRFHPSETRVDCVDEASASSARVTEGWKGQVKAGAAFCLFPYHFLGFCVPFPSGAGTLVARFVSYNLIARHENIVASGLVCC